MAAEWVGGRGAGVGGGTGGGGGGEGGPYVLQLGVTHFSGFY